MNKKKKNFLLFVLIQLSIIVIIFLGIVLGPSFYTSKKLYYIPQFEMYLKIIKPPLDKYGYVVFGKDSVLSLSEQMDYIKIHKSETANIIIIMNPQNKNVLYVDDRFNFSTFNPVKYSINRINFRDSTFFSIGSVAGASTYVLKKPYVDISIDGYLESIYQTSYNGEYSGELEPISK